MKRRNLVLLIVTAFVFMTLASCKQENLTSGDASSLDLSDIESSNTEISDSVSFDTTEREIEFKDYYFTGSLKFDYEDYMIRYSNEPKPFVIDSHYDAKTLLSMLEFESDISEFFEELPENYFKEHILLVNDFTNYSLSLRRDVSNVRADENGITVEYIYATPEEASDLVDPCLVVVEIKKADVLGCQCFNVVSYISTFAYGEYEWWFHDENFIGELDLNYTSIISDKPYPITVLSLSKLNELAEGSSSNEFKEYAKSKDRTFFEEKALVIVYVCASSSGNTFEIDSIINLSGKDMNDNRQAVIKVNQNLNGAEDMVQSHILVAEVYRYDIFPCFRLEVEAIDVE